MRFSFTSCQNIVEMSALVHILLLLAVARHTWCSPFTPLAERATLLESVSELKKTYDYVVIGGGTSGLTVANRLTENDKSISAYIQFPTSSLIRPLSV